MTALNERKNKIRTQLSSFLPTGFEDMIVDLLFKNPVHFKIVQPRTTKLGDFRADFTGKKHQITVNGDLNPYSFLVTTIHEFAHLETFLKFGRNAAPHGEEWKNEYRKLLLPALDLKILPADVTDALVKSLVSTRASSCSDMQLSRVLKKYDAPKEGVEILENLPKNTTFALQGKVFVKGELRRKRYVCEESVSRRMYLVHALSEVKLIK